MNNNLGNKEIMAKNIQRYMNLYEKDRKTICKDLGIRYTTFTDWVNGKTYPRIDKIELLASYFGITKADLVEEHSQGSRPGIPRTLSPDEAGLLDDYQKLNAAGKDKAREYISDLTGNDKYTEKGTGSEDNVSA